MSQKATGDTGNIGDSDGHFWKIDKPTIGLFTLVNQSTKDWGISDRHTTMSNWHYYSVYDWIIAIIKLWNTTKLW